MEPISQVILRNRDHLDTGPLLLVDPPADDLALELGAAGRSVRASCQEFGAFRALSDRGVEARFEPAPRARGDESTIVLRLPREKERLAMVLHALAATMASDATLWVVGEKRAGIKSASRLLAARFGQVTKRDSARHCDLLEAGAPRPCPPFDLVDYIMQTDIRIDARYLALFSLPGVFAHGRVDQGTLLLLDTLRELAVAGEVLDFACGNGIVGICLLGRSGAPQLTLLDSSALALEAARRSLAANGLRARLLPSDGLRELSGSYDWIISNPPFHRGVDNDLDIASDFFQRAGTFLKRNGRIVVVFNRHLPYERWARAQYPIVNRLAQSRDYTVLEASRP